LNGGIFACHGGEADVVAVADLGDVLAVVGVGGVLAVVGVADVEAK